MTRIGPGQGVLPDMPEVAPAPFVIDERAAVGRLLGPRAMQLLGVSPDRLSIITSEDLPSVSVDSLRADLYSDRGLQISGIAVNEDEYQIIPRSASAISASTQAKTTRARRIDHNPERAHEKVHRSVGHTLDSYDERAQGILEWLSSEHDRLAKLKKELEGYTGFAHMSQGELAELAQGVVTFSFKNIIGVVAAQRDSDADETDRLQAAMLYQLTRAPRKERLPYLKDMVGLALEYNKRRGVVFRNRLNIARTKADNAHKKADQVTR